MQCNQPFAMARVTDDTRKLGYFYADFHKANQVHVSLIKRSQCG